MVYQTDGGTVLVMRVTLFDQDFPYMILVTSLPVFLLVRAEEKGKNSVTQIYLVYKTGIHITYLQ